MRKTNETDITVEVNLDGGEIAASGTREVAASGAHEITALGTREVAASGTREVADSLTSVTAASSETPAIFSSGSHVDTGCGFLNHMLTLFAFHSCFTLTIKARGDTDVDFHHLTEDAGMALGQCIKEALGDAAGITRYASVFLPMDEALVLVALDISGRAHLNYDVAIDTPKVGDFDTELAQEFLAGLCRSLGLTLHIKLLYGANAHHIIEAIFKGLGRALREAIKLDPARRGTVPSSKGSL